MLFHQKKEENEKSNLEQTAKNTLWFISYKL